MVWQTIITAAGEAIKDKIREKKLDKKRDRGEMSKEEYKAVKKYLKDQ